MNVLKNGSDFFGLDIGTTAVRVVQLGGAGSVRNIISYGQINFSSETMASPTDDDKKKIAEVIKQVLAASKISTPNVAVNLPSNKVFTTVIDFDKLPPQQMAKALSYQADSIIPTPLAKSKLDWAVLGPSPKDPKKVEVLLSSVANDFVEDRLNLLESLGLNVIAFEPDSMAITRSLLAPNSSGSQLVLDIGYQAADLVIAMEGTTRLTRSISVGTGSILKAAAQNLNVDLNQAAQYVFKFGVAKDKLEGQVQAAIISVIDSLMSEIGKSIRFFQDRYQGAALDRIVVAGAAASIPELPLYMANQFGLNVEIGNAWRNVSVPPERDAELAGMSNYFAVAAGLAERSL